MSNWTIAEWQSSRSLAWATLRSTVPPDYSHMREEMVIRMGEWDKEFPKPIEEYQTCPDCINGTIFTCPVDAGTPISPITSPCHKCGGTGKTLKHGI